MKTSTLYFQQSEVPRFTWLPNSFVTTQAVIFLTMIFGDFLVTSGCPGWMPEYGWAVIDAPVHSLLGVLVTWTLLERKGSWRQTLLRLALVVLLPILIDIDHFVAAGSFSLYEATHLLNRPATHSLWFALSSGVVTWRITRQPYNGLLVLIALTSHLLRDTSGGGIPYQIWPLYFDRLSLLLYYSAQISLSLLAWLISCTNSFDIVPVSPASNELQDGHQSSIFREMLRST